MTTMENKTKALPLPEQTVERNLRKASLPRPTERGLRLGAQLQGCELSPAPGSPRGGTASPRPLVRLHANEDNNEDNDDDK